MWSGPLDEVALQVHPAVVNKGSTHSAVVLSEVCGDRTPKHYRLDRTLLLAAPPARSPGALWSFVPLLMRREQLGNPRDGNSTYKLAPYGSGLPRHGAATSPGEHRRLRGGVNRLRNCVGDRVRCSNCVCFPRYFGDSDDDGWPSRSNGVL